MKKFDMSKIMKMAWVYFKAGLGTFSFCLKCSWSVAKSAVVRVKSWFLNKKFSAGERYAISCCDEGPSVKRETEKAVLLSWNTKFGKVEGWVPKSCLE